MLIPSPRNPGVSGKAFWDLCRGVGGPAAMAACFSQDGKDVFLFYIGEKLAAFPSAIDKVRGQFTWLNVPDGEQEYPVNQVLQFPDIPGPGIF